MRKAAILKPEFVEFVPDRLEEGTLYVSTKFATASHLCCCGCKKEVVTPLSPTDWRLIFDGKTVSLEPSIGNWSFDCRSHYWISQNRVTWAGAFTEANVAAVRTHDKNAKAAYFEKSEKKPAAVQVTLKPRSRWERFKGWWNGSK